MENSKDSKSHHEPVCVNDFEIIAKERLPKMAFDYYMTAANDEQTYRESTMAFQR